MIRSTHAPLALVVTLCAITGARAADSPSPEVLDAVQAQLDTFTIRNDGRHFTPREGEQRTAEEREKIIAAIASLDARQTQKTGVLRLSALILSEEDLRILTQLTGIRSVYFDKCTITAEGFAHVADAWSGSLTQLAFNFVDVVGGGSIAGSMRKLDKLEWMTVNRTFGIGMDVIEVIGQFPIRSLDMNRPSEGLPAPELLKSLETRFKALRRIDLHHWQTFKAEREALLAKRSELRTGTHFERQFGVPETPEKHADT